MRRRGGSRNVQALREECLGLSAVVYHAAVLGATDRWWAGQGRLCEIAEQLGLESPPSMAELIEDPGRVDEWASRVGLTQYWE